MRRIYESDAVTRDDDAFTPNESEDPREGRGYSRWLPNLGVTRALTPNWLRYRAISVEVSTPRAEFPAGTAIPFTVTMENRFPVSVAVSTRSPLPWTWHVDGVREASHVPLRDPPAETGSFSFGRSERKRVDRRWYQRFKVSDREWERAEPGTYTIGAGLNVADARERGVYDETTVRIVPK